MTTDHLGPCSQANDPWASPLGSWPEAGASFRALDPTRPYKPLDVGEEGLVASIDPTGRLVAITQVHRACGWVVATAAKALHPGLRFDQPAIRRFRAALAGPQAASFGIQPARLAPRPAERRAWLVNDGLPATATSNGRGRLLTIVPTAAETGGVRGIVQLAVGNGDEAAIGGWAGRFRLDRAELPELTEAQPLESVPRRPRARIDGDLLVAEDPALPWALAVGGDILPIEAETRAGDVLFTARPRSPASVVYVGVGENAREAAAAVRQLADIGAAQIAQRALQRWRRRWAGLPGDLTFRRGLGYAASCCAAPVGEAVALVTDHRLLPLVWTRDGYFLARTLLGWWARAGQPEGRDLVYRHLIWLFEVAVRPEGWWARSHLANGERKDDVFQLDQQLYPLLELADYVTTTGDRIPLERWASSIEDVLRAIRARRSPNAPLYATDETAADDPTRLPYILANQILLVRCLEVLRELGVAAARLLDHPDEIRQTARSAFTIEGPDGRPVFAYATDERGSVAIGHDANDFPLVLAGAWGFVSADDPVWRATIELAFSAGNPSFFPGACGGLGSLHTPGPWPLGDLQARLLARFDGDAAAEARAVASLRARAYWDGALPEASNPETGAPTSRPWFAWPGAAYAALELAALP